MTSSMHTEKYLKTLNPFPKRVLIFAHDAGGANSTFAFALELEKKGFLILAFGEGAAAQIYMTNIPHMVGEDSPSFEKTDWVITGLSGIHSRYEVDMIKLARENGVQKITSILDVHYNIEYRFNKDNQMLSEDYLPDEIWVPGVFKRTGVDSIDKRIIDRPNPYFTFVKEKFYSTPPSVTESLVNKHKGKYWIYLTEYIKDQYGESLGYDEFSLLDSFLYIVAELSSVPPIIIKIHPQETEEKYSHIIKKYPQLSISIYRLKLQELLYYSKFVFGCMSTVFYEAFMLEKKVFSLHFKCKNQSQIEEILFPLRNDLKLYYNVDELKVDLMKITY